VRVTEIQNATLGIVHLPGQRKPWRLTIQDREYGEVLWVDMTDEVAQQIVAKLSGGIVVARGMPQ